MQTSYRRVTGSQGVSATTLHALHHETARVSNATSPLVKDSVFSGSSTPPPLEDFRLLPSSLTPEWSSVHSLIYNRTDRSLTDPQPLLRCVWKAHPCLRSDIPNAGNSKGPCFGIHIPAFEAGSHGILGPPATALHQQPHRSIPGHRRSGRCRSGRWRY